MYRSILKKVWLSQRNEFFRRYGCVLVMLCAYVSPTVLYAQSRTNVLQPPGDPRGAVDLTICSQNLANYGSLRDVLARSPAMTAAKLEAKESALVKRFVTAACDVIAVQEVLGKKEEVAQLALQKLADLLKKSTNRFYDVITGPSNDPVLRNGFLVARDRGEVLTRLSYSKVELPKLIDGGKPRLFVRGPLEIQVQTKAHEGSPSKTVIIVTFHFKSKHGGAGDPAQLEWETYRMEMAEALRRIITTRHERSFVTGETLLVVLGDRNSNFDSASAQILDGVLTLNDFKGDGVCRLSKRGVPLCQAGNADPRRLFSVLTLDPQTKLLSGTFKYKKEYSWLDDILMPAESLRTAWTGFDTVGDFASGVLYEPKAASDHALTYVRLNW